jgi:phage-related protein
MHRLYKKLYNVPGQALKPIVWMGDSLDVIRGFSMAGRQRAGFELGRVQAGQEPTDWKPMPTVGPGVREVRVHAENEYRVLYVASFRRCVYVLHAFAKKSGRTSKADLETGKNRLRHVVLREERNRDEASR